MLMRTDRRDAPVHGRHELVAAALPQVREADGDDEEGLEPFPKRDDEGLEHGESTVLRSETQSQNLGPVYFRYLRPVKSAFGWRQIRGRGPTRTGTQRIDARAQLYDMHRSNDGRAGDQRVVGELANGRR